MRHVHEASDSVECVSRLSCALRSNGARGRSRTQQAALSLIEIIVVLSILLVLAAIIAPSIASSRLQARRAEVKSALRQAGMQLELYAADYDQASARTYPLVDHWMLEMRPKLPQQTWSVSPQTYVYYPRHEKGVPEGYGGQTSFGAWERALQLSDGQDVPVIANFSLTLNCLPTEFISSCLWDGIAITNQQQLRERKGTGEIGSPLWWLK